MASTKYRPNHSGVAAYLRSETVYSVVKAQAESMKSYAESISPVGSPPDDKHPGEYRASFDISRSEVVINGTPHVTAKLENTSGHAAAVEWGYAGSKGEDGKNAHHVLTRACEAAGVA